MNRYAKRTALAAACAAALCGPVTTAQAANWIMLQGTEKPNDIGTAEVWGFIQAEYQKDYSDPNVNPAGQGQYIPPKLIGPDLNSQEGFNVNRARIGVRGQNFPLDPKVNYFFLAEFGNNGITHSVDGSVDANGDTTISKVSSKTARLTDASITLNHIPGARIRVGLFKTPGFEEGLQAIHVFNYVNFTEVGNQLMLERFPNPYYTANTAATNPLQPNSLNGFTQPVGAYRDTGVQVFDAFTTGDWEHTYAFMIGNGSGLNYSDSDGDMDRYFYLSTERMLGGDGVRRDGFKVFAWRQTGRRLLDQTAGDGYNPQLHKRIREGLGFTYVDKPLRLTAEYIQGEGMIFVGPDKPTFDQATAGPLAAYGNGADGKASGWYIEGGYRIPNSKFELDLRADVFNRLEGDMLESLWKTWTYGVQYHLSPKSRVTLNYATRDVTSVHFGPGTGGANPNNALQTIDSRLALQVTTIF